MLRVLVRRPAFAVDCAWAGFAMAMLSWACGWDARTAGFVALFGLWVNLHLVDARVVFAHSGARGRAYDAFNRSCAGRAVRGATALAVVSGILSLLAIPVVLANGLVVGATFVNVPLVPGANATVVDPPATGRVSPPPGFLGFLSI